MLIDLITTIVKKLTDKPEKVTVQQLQTDGKSVIQVRVAASDLSRIIGSEGRTFRALRTLVQTLASGPLDLVVDSNTES